MCLKVDKRFNLYFNSNISENNYAMALKLGMMVDLCIGYIEQRVMNAVQGLKEFVCELVEQSRALKAKL